MAKKIKSLPVLKKSLQETFNHYVRLRDKGKPCISCNQHKPYLQAGHYWSVKMCDVLRFNEDNCHGECPGCNGFDACHLIYYTENLKLRIGKDKYNELKQLAEDYKKVGYRWSRSEVIELTKYYKQKIKKLES
ncbi:recombinase [bacterium]|nr:MAG: recombinase [bacterium]